MFTCVCARYRTYISYFSFLFPSFSFLTITYCFFYVSSSAICIFSICIVSFLRFPLVFLFSFSCSLLLPHKHFLSFLVLITSSRVLFLIDFITVYFLHSINLYFPLSFLPPCIFFLFLFYLRSFGLSSLFLLHPFPLSHSPLFPSVLSRVFLFCQFSEV